MNVKSLKKLGKIAAILGLIFRIISFIVYIVAVLGIIILLIAPDVALQTGVSTNMSAALMISSVVLCIGAAVEIYGFIYTLRWSKRLSEPVNSNGTTALLVFGAIGIASWLFSALTSADMSTRISGLILYGVPMVPSLLIIILAISTRRLAKKNK